ncbi:hypothetical protein O0I10_010452 [Lichtheimia ornata]|uniref:SWIM-type domain-containing protein n=1 Tax=Lichtheimia ornata TaxID=688661 RepID=A0AAD7XTI4_9FUNG|nr:uncharacterized protein O0I10_010452 [Lichtheimia ornata]KAJ8653885.1 hypothetical protein O0I10_010452 [Lichtheimia ornata]
MAEETHYALQFVDTLFEELAASKELTIEHAHRLHEVFETKLQESFYLIDNNAVERAICQAGRVIYRVSDACFQKDDRPNTWYTCFLDPRYCSCAEFRNATLCDRSTVMCRHILAVALVDALDLLSGEEPIDDEEFAEIMYRWTL